MSVHGNEEEAKESSPIDPLDNIGRASDEEREEPIVWPELQGGKKILRRKEAKGSVLRLPSLMMAISMPNAASIPVHDNDNEVGETGLRSFAVPTAVGLSVGLSVGRTAAAAAPSARRRRSFPVRHRRVVPGLPCLASLRVSVQDRMRRS